MGTKGNSKNLKILCARVYLTWIGNICLIKLYMKGDGGERFRYE